MPKFITKKYLISVREDILIYFLPLAHRRRKVKNIGEGGQGLEYWGPRGGGGQIPSRHMTLF